MRWTIVGLFLLIPLLGGCQHDPVLVGKWTGTLFQSPVEAEFKDNKTAEFDLTQDKIKAKFDSTYEVEPKAVTITFTKYQLAGVSNSYKPLASTYLDPLLNKPMKIQYHFNNADEVALTYQSKVDLLKRVKTESSH